MKTMSEQIAAIGIVPVIKIDKVEDAVPLAKALCKGGLPCAEVTFRTDAAEESIRAIANAVPDMLVGAGTVLTTDQVDRAIAAGAKFIVSPGLNPRIVSYCLEKKVPIFPGTANPSDIEIALELGLDVVKFFPAEANGGLNAIKAMAAPYVNMKFMPTGGINQKNLNDYLAFNRIIACGGSWMVDPALINAGDFEGITTLTRGAVQTMLGFEIAHVGVNANGTEDAQAIAKRFCSLLGLAFKEGNSSIFSGKLVEVMKENGRGKNGHIGIATNSISRARHYLEGQGWTFDESSLKFNDKGEPAVIYLNEEIGGFALHLVPKK